MLLNAGKLLLIKLVLYSIHSPRVNKLVPFRSHFKLASDLHSQEPSHSPFLLPHQKVLTDSLFDLLVPVETWKSCRSYNEAVPLV